MMKLGTLSLVLFLGLSACAPPEFLLPPAPSVEGLATAPVAPPVTREDPLAKVPRPVEVDDARASDWPFTGKPSIAVLPVEAQGRALPSIGSPITDALGKLLGDEMVGELGSLVGSIASAANFGGPGDVATQVERLLPLLLLRAGFEHFVSPDQLRAIAVEKQAKRDGEVTWRSSLARLMQVEPVSDVDLQLGIEVVRAGPTVAVVQVGYRVDQAQLDGYEKAYDTFHEPAVAQLQSAQAARERYLEQVKRAREEYEQDGGGYDPAEPTSGDEALAQAKDVVAKLDQRILTLQGQLAETPSPDELREAVRGRTDEVEVPAYEFAIRARMVDSSNMRVLWIADLQTRDLTQEAAMERVLQRVVDELSPSGG
jgi:hypothetical protein